MNSITVIKADDPTNFTILSNESIYKLTPAASGMHRYMMSKPDTWMFYVAGVAKETNCTKYAVEQMLKELTEVGYVKTIVRSEGRGKLMNIRFVRSRLDQDWPKEVNDGVVQQRGSDGRFVDGIYGHVNTPDVTIGHDNPARIVRTESKKELKGKRTDNNNVVDMDTRRTNRHAGECLRCSQLVEANKGILVGKKPAHATQEECIALTLKAAKKSVSAYQRDRVASSWQETQ